MQNFVYSNDIKSFFIDVSEKIETKNLNKFITTSLKLKNITINKNDFVHINFISELKQYQVLIFSNEKKAIFQIFELFYLDKKELLEFDLYVWEEFFCIYKNGEFYYFQKLETQILIDDLLEYINKFFLINIDNCKIIDKTYFQDLQTNYLQKNTKTKLENFNKRKDFGFYIYFLYIGIIFYSSIFVYDDFLQTNKNEPITNEYDIEKLKKEYVFSSILKDYKNLSEQLNQYNLNIISFEYKEDKVKLVLSSNSKSNIYSFLTILKDNLISQDINFFENKNIYESTIHVKLSK
jgi:hypothetical protein